MISRTPMLVVLLAAAALGVVHCGGTTTSATNDAGALPDGYVPPTPPGPPPANLPPPTSHRPGAIACPTTRPAGLNADGGASDAGFPGGCTVDSQCTSGKNGRCLPPNRGGPHICSYDACFVDDDCGAGKLCTCGDTLANGSDGTPMRTGSVCLPGNCRTDGDCGAGGYCSPTFDTSCGPYDGVQGYYCHTPNDACTNDDQCTDGGRAGYCAWQPALGKWACANTACAG